ncbi:phage tail tube protein [Embleya hyalina]|uniref:Phage tail protein n=1 Tax=Embleya hyalina TaxID=516124 RepID=A0A401YZ79_9ACTN|nr:hypothetical protein [Embleya hyalina]GCD99860.1 hypothetical protein EHYA_07582 [Embleya hyalina]
MANDAHQIRFAPAGALYLAPAPKNTPGGTVLPTTIGDGKTAPAGYKDFGYADESGVTITPQIETDPVNVWQSAVPVLYNVKGASFKIKATLMQTTKITTELFFGAPWKPVLGNDGKETGIFRLDISSTPDLSELSLVVDWSERNVMYRCVIGRAMVSDRGAIQLQRTENQKYELTIDALDYSGSLGYVLTNDDINETGSVVTPASAALAATTVEQGATVKINGLHFKAGSSVTGKAA